jgi:hypothetical protein
MDGVTIPGTAQIRKIGAQYSSMELLELCAQLAQDGLDKKLFSVLSRVYTEHKGFRKKEESGMREKAELIISAKIPSELKMQAFTSFEFPKDFAPDAETIIDWVNNCSPKRMNIAGYFLAVYADPEMIYKLVLGNKVFFRTYAVAASPDALLAFTDSVIENEEKEVITGLIRGVKDNRKYIAYKDEEAIGKLTQKIFSSKKVFYTTKLIFCIAYNVPAACLPQKRELYKMLRITINYDERTSREFASKYHLDFDTSDEAVCNYHLKNKKTENERMLVSRFATHLVRINDQQTRGRLLHQAFRRGGYFRMYAGCMQDGYVNEDKQRHFHYTDEQIAWVQELPGLKK